MPVQEKLPSVVEVVAIGHPPAAQRRHDSGRIAGHFPAPILIVQHITALALRLDRPPGCSIDVGCRFVSLGAERIQPGIVYIAPDACHLLVAK